MTTWYIIRHGETLNNRKHIKQGQCASLLTLKGIKQSKSIAKRLQKLEPDFSKFKFITSPIVRTKHTMQIILETLNLDTEPIEDSSIMSRNKGIFQGCPKKEFPDRFPKEYEEIQKDPWNYTPPNGESLETAHKRFLEFLEKYKNEENLIIVMHKRGSTTLRMLLEKKSKQEIREAGANHNQDFFFKWDDKQIIQL